MKSYKKLKSKKKIIDKRATIGELHEKKMKEFEEYYSSLPEKEEELKKIRNKIESLDKKDYKNMLTIKDLQKEEKDLKKVIYEMENQTDMCKYLLDVSHIFLKQSKLKEEQKKVEEENSKEQKSNEQKEGINKYIIVKEGIQKGNLLNEYLSACEGSIYSPSKKENIFLCNQCGGHCIVNSKECFLTCSDCGTSKQWQDPSLPQWSDEVDVTKAYRYKRLGYFIEHLYRIQAKECTIIPDTVINKLLIELKKRRITDPNKITTKLIKGFLKNLDLTSYYDNVNSIIRTLSGREAPVFPETLEDKLVVMFMRTQDPFERFKDIIPDRNNYLSYPYVIRQLLIIIAKTEQRDDILPFVKMFPLLKSRLKLWYQEKVWEKICEDLEWPFYPSM